MKLSYWHTNPAFKHPFTISKGTKTHQPSLIVELRLGPFSGYGEAPAIGYYNITVEKMIADLESKRTLVEKFAFTDPERYWHYLHHLFPQNPFLVCALDMAGWDLFGKMKRQPVYKLWNTTIVDGAPETDYTIGLDNIDTMVAKMKEMPWPIYKVKLGGSNDIAIIEALRKHTDATIRVDVNEGWTYDEAVDKINKLSKLNIELIEQPLKKDDWDGMKRLYELSPIPLIADESCVFEQHVDQCFCHFHGINIKLTKCSGITPARRMIKRAKELQMSVMMGSMNESTVGSSAIVQFVPQLNYLDVDGPLLLTDDIAVGFKYNKGKIELSTQPGLGFLMTF